MTTAHVRGPSEPALLHQTIGANLREVARRFADREALDACAQDVRLTYAELDARGGPRRPAALLAPGSRPATASASGAPTAASGPSSSTPPRASGSSRSASTRPTAPPSSPTCCASPAAACSWPRRRSRPRTTWEWRRRSGPSCPSSRARCGSATPEWDERFAPPAPPSARCTPAPPEASSTTRSTSSTRAARPASPRARRSRHNNILNNGYSSPGHAPHGARTGLHPGPLLSLLRPGHGQPRRA